MNEDDVMRVRDEDRTFIDDFTPGLSLGDDVGHVVVAVRPDGSTEFWIMVPGGAPATTVPFPPHELLGPLPAAVARRLHRCGAPCRDGHACEVEVSVLGRRCGHHKVVAS